MRISELARRTGVSVHTLRYYEGLGLLKAGRSASGYRDFSEGAVREVTFIVMGRDSGFSLKEIGEYLPAYRAGSLSVDTLIEAFAERLADVDAQIARLQVLRGTLIDHIAWFRRRAPASPSRRKSR
ncbi:MAG: MerR family transcriptional regulator [Burkholderiaceae bacterium]|nr:MerR family transcriptional regulator [Burkholderiaceae bacterium]